jgi:carboxyl-terminal processing protease
VKKPIGSTLAFVAGSALLGWACHAQSAAKENTPSRPNAPAELARRVQEITDAVLAHHINPPVRQQMILDGIKALYHTLGLPVSPSLSLRVSEVAAPEQLTALLSDIWPSSAAKTHSPQMLEEAFVEGMLASVPGGAHIMSAQERKVAEQFQGNRYVGIHIALGVNDEQKLPSMFDVFEGGPADRAGVLKGDLLEEVNGMSTRGVLLREVVDRLRGEEGTDVTIKVRQPKAKTSRVLKITRGQRPHATVQGLRKQPSGDWDTRVNQSDSIAYLRINEIAASTPHELRKLAQQLQREKAQALVLDLRGLRGSSIHPAALLADTLLDQGTIGRTRTVHGETTYEADSDGLFQGWPLAVLVDSGTGGTAEWIAAALQDNHRAVLVGTPTSGATLPHLRFPVPNTPTQVVSTIAIGDGSWSIELTTATLEHGDGRPLTSAIQTEAAAESPLAVRAARQSKPAEIKTGVKPDHEMKQVRAREFGAAVPQAAKEGRDVRPDEVIDKAVQLLREALKKARPEPRRENEDS